MKDSKKTYLGDSVYAQFDGYHIILTTENGLPDDPSNRIALEPQVIGLLKRYYDRVWDEATKKRSEEEANAV
jgi:hypothetical protein